MTGEYTGSPNYFHTTVIAASPGGPVQYYYPAYPLNPYPYWQPYWWQLPFYPTVYIQPIVQPDPKIAELEGRIEKLEKKLGKKIKTATVR